MGIRCLAPALLLVAACGGSSSGSFPAATSDSGSGSADGGSDGSATTDATLDSSSPPPEGGGTALTCPGPLTYLQNGGSCGTLRWSIKTGKDSAAAGISLVPQPTTIAALGGLAAPANLPFSSRVSPVETTVWELKDVRLIYVRLETDSDYHLGLTDTGANMMIAEIPFPGCATGSAWSCFIARARGTLDAKYQLAAGQGMGVDDVVSVIGVGFWDTDHGQSYAAPNNIELHSVLALCFGQGCVPGQ